MTIINEALLELENLQEGAFDTIQHSNVFGKRGKEYEHDGLIVYNAIYNERPTLVSKEGTSQEQYDRMRQLGLNAEERTSGGRVDIVYSANKNNINQLRDSEGCQAAIKEYHDMQRGYSKAAEERQKADNERIRQKWAERDRNSHTIDPNDGPTEPGTDGGKHIDSLGGRNDSAYFDGRNES